MLSDDEIEQAQKTMANGLEMLWFLHDKQPSDQLNAALDEHPEISDEIWLDTLKKVRDPMLVSYAVQYLGLNSSAKSHTQTSRKKVSNNIWMYAVVAVVIIWLMLG